VSRSGERDQRVFRVAAFAPAISPTRRSCAPMSCRGCSA
jgi:hypothetical protein